MRYQYEVIDITDNINNDKIDNMEAMSLKKLKKKLDHKKLFKVKYTNKKGHLLIVHLSGIEPKWFIYLQTKKI